MHKPVPLWQTAALSIAIGAAFVLLWHVLTVKPQVAAGPSSEYARLAGAAAGKAASAMPTPGQVVQRAGELFAGAFRGYGSNNQGIAFHLLDSLVRVLSGFALAVVVAVPLGLALGMSPLLYGALNPYIQVLKPISPLAWLPLALYTFRDSATSAIFVIFICALCSC